MSVASTLRDWLAERRLRQEIEAMPAAEREALAHDSNISESMLGWIMEHGTGGEQLPQMLRELDISEAAIRRDYPAVLRDMQVTCAACTEGKRCQRELDQGQAAHVLGYCPNAVTIASMRTELLETVGNA